MICIACRTGADYQQLSEISEDDTAGNYGHRQCLNYGDGRAWVTEAEFASRKKVTNALCDCHCKPAQMRIVMEVGKDDIRVHKDTLRSDRQANAGLE